MEKLSLLALKALSPLYDMHFSTAPEKQCPTMMEVVSIIPMGIRLFEGKAMLIVFQGMQGMAQNENQNQYK